MCFPCFYHLVLLYAAPRYRGRKENSCFSIFSPYIIYSVPGYIRGIPGRFDQAVILTIFFLFSFKYVMDDHKKITYNNFQIFF